MGQSQSTNPIKYTRTIDDQHFGKIQIFEQKQNPAEYIMKYATSTGIEKEVKPAYEFKHRLYGLKHRVLSKFHYIQVEEVKICLVTYFINCYYSFYNLTLYQIFTRRVENESLFPENELWYILRSLIELGGYLQGQGLAIQDYNLKKIFITPGGFVKVYLTEMLENHCHSNLNKCFHSVFPQNLCLLSPQQINIRKENKVEINYDIYKADVFSIGIMMVQLMCLDEGTFYDFNSFSIDLPKIRYTLHGLKTTYSASLVDFVSKMLQENPSDRYDFKVALEQISDDKNQMIDCTKSIGANITLKRKSQLLLSTTTLNTIDFNSKLVAAPINSMVFKKRPSKSVSKKDTGEKEN